MIHYDNCKHPEDEKRVHILDTSSGYWIFEFHLSLLLCQYLSVMKIIFLVYSSQSNVSLQPFFYRFSQVLMFILNVIFISCLCTQQSNVQQSQANLTIKAYNYCSGKTVRCLIYVPGTGTQFLIELIIGLITLIHKNYIVLSFHPKNKFDTNTTDQ